MDNTTMGQLQDSLGVVFRDKDLLRQALTHPSYTNEHLGEATGSNQRLEFLGDAVLGLVVAREVFSQHPELEEGDLTELRSQMVRGQSLAGVARGLGLGQHLLLGQGEAASGGRDRDSNLAAALEALVGALFLDQGFRPAQRLVLRIMKPEMAEIRAQALPKDPKSRLQEEMQRQGRSAPGYQVLATEGPAHRRRFTVQVVVEGRTLGTGQGQSKVDAERQAALEALRGEG